MRWGFATIILGLAGMAAEGYLTHINGCWEISYPRHGTPSYEFWCNNVGNHLPWVALTSIAIGLMILLYRLFCLAKFKL
jgi:hypothetical protein